MRPVRLSLLALFWLIAFTPAINIIAPSLLIPLLAGVVLAAAIPALVSFKSVLGGPRRAVVTTYDFGAARWLGWAIVAMAFVSFVRTWAGADSAALRKASGTDLIYLVLILFAVWAAKVIGERMRLRFDPFGTAVYVLALLCAANLVLWAMGVRSDYVAVVGEDDAQVLSLLGVRMSRVLFPMSWGVNSFSIISGSVLAIGLTKWLRTRKQRATRRRDFVLIVAAPLACLLLSDSRGSLGFALIAAVGYHLLPRLSRLGLVAFFGVALTAVLLPEIFSTLGLARESGGTAFTQREVIWGAGLASLSRFDPMQLIGYGAFGQFESGAWMMYEQLFRNISDAPELMSLHNAYLQLVLDVGYVGLAVVVAFVLLTVPRMHAHAVQTGNWRYAGAAVLLIFLTINGLTEVTMSLYQPWMALLLIALVAMLRERIPRPT